MSQINKIHTPCRDCVFATYDGITQVGCALNYLDKYKLKDVEIIEVYDETKEFYVVNNKKCIGYRENKWFTQYGLEHGDIRDKIAKFNELNHIDYMAVVDLKTFINNDLAELEFSLKHIVHKPSKIIFIRYQNDKNFPYEKIKSFMDNAGLNCKWRIQTMVDDSLSNADILHNIVNLNKHARFVLSINGKSKDIGKLIDKANQVVYEDLDIFTAIKNNDGSAILFSAPSYRWSSVVMKQNILDKEENFITV